MAGWADQVLVAAVAGTVDAEVEPGLGEAEVPIQAIGRRIGMPASLAVNPVTDRASAAPGSVATARTSGQCRLTHGGKSVTFQYEANSAISAGHPSPDPRCQTDCHGRRAVSNGPCLAGSWPACRPPSACPCSRCSVCLRGAGRRWCRGRFVRARSVRAEAPAVPAVRLLADQIGENTGRTACSAKSHRRHLCAIDVQEVPLSTAAEN
jgi:hypothetical protein